MTFPDDILERRSVEARWVAVFPVGGANTAEFCRFILRREKQQQEKPFFGGGFVLNLGINGENKCNFEGSGSW